MTGERNTRTVNPEYAPYPVGRYEKYEAKMKKLAARLAFIKKHRVGIIISSTALVLCVLSFLFCMGIMWGEAVCSDLTYGDMPSMPISSFLCEVKYEYSAGNGEWSDTYPTRAGEYLIRAVTVNLLGIKRYSNEVKFVLYQKDVSVSVGIDSCIYGELTESYIVENLKYDTLADGDLISHINIQFDYITWSKVKVSISNVRISNSDGADVTDAYNIQCKKADITVSKRNITLKTDTVEKEYDGVAYTSHEWKISEGTLAAGDRLNISFFKENKDAGLYLLIPDEFSIVNSNGETVTQRYNIKEDWGKLLIKEIPLVLSSASAEKVYDGTPLECTEGEIISGSVLDGHTLKVDMHASQTRAGSAKNTLKVEITDSDGQSVVNNYDIQTKEGTLTVIPITLKFKTESATKVYDGLELTEKGCSHISGELVSGDTMQFATTGTRTDVGKSKNTLKVTVRNSLGIDVTSSGYKIEVDEGTLEVTPRPITLLSASKSKAYDGTPLVCHELMVIAGSLIGEDTVVEAYFTGYQTEVGKSDNTFTVKKITNTLKENLTNNYDITYEYGVLEVVEQGANEIPNNGETSWGDKASIGTIIGGLIASGIFDDDSEQNKNYIDKIIENATGDPSKGSGLESLPDDLENFDVAKVTLQGKPGSSCYVYLRATSYGDYTGSGFLSAPLYINTDTSNSYSSILDFVANSATYKSKPLTTASIQRLQAATPVLVPYFPFNTSDLFGQNDVYFESSKMQYDLFVFEYDIAGKSPLDMQSYTVAPYKVSDENAYRSFVYNVYLQSTDGTNQKLREIGERNGIYASANRVELVYQIKQLVQSSATYNMFTKDYPTSEDAALYFFEVQEGNCKHYATAATMMFRAYGIPARYTTGFLKEIEYNKTETVKALDAHAWVEVYIDRVGWIPVEVTGSDGKTKLTVTAYSASKEYDTQPFSDWEQYRYSLDGSLKPGHTIKVYMEEKGLKESEPGTYVNTITKVEIFDENGNNVTSSEYNLQIQNGSMTIQRRLITVSTGSKTKVYDGQPLLCEQWWINSGSLLPEHKLYMEFESITDIGSIKNREKSFKIYLTDDKGNIVGDAENYYEVKFIYGTLEVTKE